MIIETPDGNKIEVPDSFTDEQIKNTIQRYNADIAAGAPADPVAHELQAMKRNMPTAFDTLPDTLPHGMTPEMTKALLKDAANQTEAYNRTVQNAIDDPKARANYELGKRASGTEAFGVSAINELVAFGKGTANLGDKHLPSWMSNALHFNEGTPESRMAQRASDMAQQNSLQEGLSLAHPLTSMLGQGLPYMLTEAVGGPLINTTAKVGARAVSPLAKAGFRGAELMENTAANSASPLVRQLGKITAEPIVTAGKHFKAAPVMDMEYSNAVKSIARAPILGAAEGGANYNSTASQGAFNSLGGQLLGLASASKLGRPAVLLSDSEKTALKNAVRDGYTATPGMRTGNVGQQKFEAGLRSEPGFDLYMQNLDAANNTAKAKMAGKAMGLDNVDSRDFSPEVLGQHMQTLKTQYTALENNTTGKMGMGKIREAGAVLKDLQPTTHANTSPLDRTRYQTVKSIFDQFKAEIASPRRGANGQFQGYEFNGSQYQMIRQRIQDEASQAYRNGDNRLGDSLTKMKGILDSSLTSGMDKATASQWKDLNERYAMTKTVVNNGMDALGGIDANKLGAYLLSDNEARRTLTSQGGRIKHLQDIAKITEMEARQGGTPGWNGTGIEGSSAKSGMLQRILRMPVASTVMPTKRAGMALYMSGYPAVTGYTMLPKPAIASMTRAESQAGGWPTVGKDYVMGRYQDLLNAMKEKM